jgi:hypothetical protein
LALSVFSRRRNFGRKWQILLQKSPIEGRVDCLDILKLALATRTI